MHVPTPIHTLTTHIHFHSHSHSHIHPLGLEFGVWGSEPARAMSHRLWETSERPLIGRLSASFTSRICPVRCLQAVNLPIQRAAYR